MVELPIIDILEAAAAFIGMTVDSAWEALIYVGLVGRAEQFACELSEFAQSVFRVVCEAPEPTG